MPQAYNLIKEYSSLSNAKDISYKTDDVTLTPYWVIAVVRLSYPLSFSREATATASNVDYSYGIQKQGNASKVIITSDCVNLQISNTKDSHLKTLNATLIQGNLNYLTAISTSDWIMAWMVHDKEKYDDLLDRINSGDAVNRFDDGIKFVGRVHSIRKHLSLDAATGTKEVKYQLQAFAFHELDSSFIYSQYLSDDSDVSKSLPLALAKMGLELKDLVGSQPVLEQINNVDRIVTKLLNILMGTGLTAVNSEQAGTPTQAYGAGARPVPTSNNTKEQEGKTPPFGYLVPEGVSQLLNIQPIGDQHVTSYMDILQVLVGIQKYTGDMATEDYGGLIPHIDINNELSKGSVRHTGEALLGSFLILPPGYDSRPVWSILQQFVNQPVNEIYTCMRVNEAGNVAPTVVLRQVPFTTGVFSKRVSKTDFNIKTTEYMSVCRWYLPSIMVKSIDLGFSNATRCNFVWTFGQDANQENNLPIPQQAGRNGPVFDYYDISKNGLSPLVTTVACNVVNQEGAVARYWSELIADHMIGSHQTLNGTIECIGIQAPICEGDNLEFEGMIYHIEGVAHRCMVEPNNGNKMWATTLTLTRGMPKDDNSTRSDIDIRNPIYAGFSTGDIENERSQNAATLDPGISDDAGELDVLKEDALANFQILEKLPKTGD